MAAAKADRLTPMEHAWMNLFWFANNLHWGALLGVIIPSQVEKFLGTKALHLPAVVVWGTLVAVLVHPWAGALSDRIRSRLGRRRPFLLLGTLLNVPALLLMARAESLTAMAVAFVLVQFANNWANSPYVAIIADRVPAEQRGVASGWFGFMSVLGTIAGAVLAGLLISKQAALPLYRQQLLLSYGLIAAVQAIAALLTWWRVAEEPAPGGPRLSWPEFLGLFWVRPGLNPDFFWVYLTRFLLQQGQWAIFFYLQYYFEDVMHLPGERTVASFTAVMMLAATLAVLGAGWLSDRAGRKRIVYLAGGLMTCVALLFALLPFPGLVLLEGALFGLGYGAFSSVDQALAVDVLPDQANHGRDMGIWQVASILPQITGIVLGGLTLHALRAAPAHLGYRLLMLLTTLCFLLGTLLVRKVRGVR